MFCFCETFYLRKMDPWACLRIGFRPRGALEALHPLTDIFGNRLLSRGMVQNAPILPTPHPSGHGLSRSHATKFTIATPTKVASSNPRRIITVQYPPGLSFLAIRVQGSRTEPSRKHALRIYPHTMASPPETTTICRSSFMSWKILRIRRIPSKFLGSRLNTA